MLLFLHIDSTPAKTIFHLNGRIPFRFSPALPPIENSPGRPNSLACPPRACANSRIGIELRGRWAAGRADLRGKLRRVSLVGPACSDPWRARDIRLAGSRFEAKVCELGWNLHEQRQCLREFGWRLFWARGVSPRCNQQPFRAESDVWDPSYCPHE